MSELNGLEAAREFEAADLHLCQTVPDSNVLPVSGILKRIPDAVPPNTFPNVWYSLLVCVLISGMLGISRECIARSAWAVGCICLPLVVPF